MPLMKSRVEKRHRAALAASVMAGAIAMAAPARALTLGPAASEFGIDPSMRSQAMGGASGAVFWGRGPNDWANPALLGLAEGITYEDGGGVQYEEARLEEFYSLPATTSRAWRVWLSPMEIVRALR
jgi:hypothetical protein